MNGTMMNIDETLRLQIDYLSKIISLAEDLEARFGKWPHTIPLVDWVQIILSDAQHGVSENEEPITDVLQARYTHAMKVSAEQMLADVTALEEAQADKRRQWLQLFDEPNEEITRLFEGEPQDER
jgi:hypothetical protein